jgi:Protein of unknown function (DUF1588)/Protein of unknown function (DUF1592)
MRNVSRSVTSVGWFSALALGAGLGCHGKVEGVSGSGGGHITGTGGTTTGTGGAAGMDVPCSGASDPRLVPAPQRIERLTMNEVVNTVSYLIDATEANTIKTSGSFGALNDETQRYFPPLDGEDSTINAANWSTLDGIANHVADYVQTNFATITGCGANPTDTCATTYLNALAAKAYRRQLTTAEQQRFTALYTGLKSYVVQGYTVTLTVQEATRNSVYALLSTPQMLWRSEIGNPATASTSPPGVYLTDDELATHLAFFLTDMPPDDMLLSAARAGTLRTNLQQHVTRILGTQPAKDWLRTMISTFYGLNQLNRTLNTVDRTKFIGTDGMSQIFGQALLNDMGTEARMFLDNTLWKGSLSDLLLSRTAFVNQGLAIEIYKVPTPAGANGTTFVQTMLPSDQRSGILTNAAYITARAGAQEGSVVQRGRLVKGTMLCLTTPPPPDAVSMPGGPLDQAKAMFATQTVQQQVAYRASIPLCKGCHGSFDAYGMLLDHYDNIARYRTLDDKNMPVDSHAALPPELGGATIQDALALAQTLAASPAFTDCMSTTLLQYALIEQGTAPVQMRLPPSQSGCAAGSVADKFSSSSSKTFTDLVNAVASSPAFVLRAPAP